MSDLDELRERLTERTVFELVGAIGDNRLHRVPCVCAKDRKPCTYHEGVESGVDAVLALLEPAGWVHADGAVLAMGTMHRTHLCRPLYRIKGQP